MKPAPSSSCAASKTNYPSILAVGRTVKQPMVVETPDGDELVIRPLMLMTLSVDHRVVDGAVAARFLQDVVAGLEEPDRLLW